MRAWDGGGSAFSKGWWWGGGLEGRYSDHGQEVIGYQS